MTSDLNKRFGFLVSDVARLYGRSFDRSARKRLHLTRAQCRLIAVLSIRQGDESVTQAALSEYMDLTPMGVATLCERMEVAGWISRQPDPGDRRVNVVSLKPKAYEALAAALHIGNALQIEALNGLSTHDRTVLVRLLRKVHVNLTRYSLAEKE